MDFNGQDPVRERCLKLGRKFGWFNVVLTKKVEALQKEIEIGREANGIYKRSKADFSYTGNREETTFDNKAITSYDTVDCNDDIDAGDDIRIDNNGQINESVIILDSDDSAGDNKINDDDSRCDDDEDNGDDVDNNIDASDDIDTEHSDYNGGYDNVNNNSVNNGGEFINAYDGDDDDNEANFDNSDDGTTNANSDGHVNHDDDDADDDQKDDDVHSDADASDDNNVDDVILDNSDATDNRFSDDDDDDVDCRSSTGNKDDDDIHIEDAFHGVSNVGANDGSIIDANGGASDNDDDADDVQKDVDDVHSDADASDDNNVEDVILDNSDDTNDKRFSDDDDDDTDSDGHHSTDNEDDDDDIHIEDAFDGDGNIGANDGSIIDANGNASDNSVIDNDGHGGIQDYKNAIDKIACDDDGKLVGGIIDDGSDADGVIDDSGDDSDSEDVYDNDDTGSDDGSNHVDDEDDGGGDNHADYSGVNHEPDYISNSLEISEEMPTGSEYGMHLDISKNDKKATEEKDQCQPVEDCKIIHNTYRHSFNSHDFQTSNEIFNEEKTEDRDGTEINGESQFVAPYSHRDGIFNDHQDGGVDNFNDYINNGDDNVDGDIDDDGNDDGVRYSDIDQEEKDVATLVNSADLVMGDNSDSVVISRPTSSLTNCSNNDDVSISDSPVKPSLSARLFKKYNPEKSECDVDDFELFLQKIRTPKKVLPGEEQKREKKSMEQFIVDDDDDFEDDVFMDLGFTPEEYCSDKENDDCIEIATPVTSYTPLKTPSTVCSWKTAESSESRKDTVPRYTPFQTPSTNQLSWKTPKSTKPKCDTGTSSRPKSVLDKLLASYATQKDFKKSRERLAKDLFELYNQTVFDNQLPSDFQITWNKNMRSTAGFCYYSKKNGVWMSRIELADKVIDSADRLRDTLIHELCHAASWIISGIKAGHGPVWKRWTLRANFVHQDLPPISRCHSYTINAKYTYRCTRCQNTFGRHSKSVNLEKSRCAYCHSRLELVPQLKKDGTPQTRTPSQFALFVKENFARIKKDNQNFSHQEVMKALSSEFAKLRT